MEKKVICTKCGKTFAVQGNRGSMREVDQPVSCPYCGEPNEILWPVDMGFTVEKLSE